MFTFSREVGTADTGVTSWRTNASWKLSFHWGNERLDTQRGVGLESLLKEYLPYATLCMV